MFSRFARTRPVMSDRKKATHKKNCIKFYRLFSISFVGKIEENRGKTRVRVLGGNGRARTM